MTPRLIWFVAGTAAGVYGAAKARRAAYRLSAPGLVDQAAALGEGWRAFSAELHDGMAAREHEVVQRLTADPPIIDQQVTSLRLEQVQLDKTRSDKKAT